MPAICMGHDKSPPIGQRPCVSMTGGIRTSLSGCSDTVPLTTRAQRPLVDSHLGQVERHTGTGQEKRDIALLLLRYPRRILLETSFRRLMPVTTARFITYAILVAVTAGFAPDSRAASNSAPAQIEWQAGLCGANRVFLFSARQMANLR